MMSLNVQFFKICTHEKKTIKTYIKERNIQWQKKVKKFNFLKKLINKKKF